MKNFIKYAILLLIGGASYYFIEILARGFSHWTMFLVGGICFILVGIINEVAHKLPLAWQMLLSAVIITFVEFVAGCILNLWLGLSIWDYTDEFGNILGQICPKHTLYWFLLSAVAVFLDDFIRYKLFGEEKPHYKIV